MNDLSSEIEMLEQQIQEMTEEIERYKGQGLSTDNQRKKLLKEFEEKLSKTELKAEHYESKYQKALKTINSIKSAIENIFNSIECEKIIEKDLLGAQGVTESNMMGYLGVIEQRRTEILQGYGELVSKKQERNEKMKDIPFVNMNNLLATGPKMEALETNIRVEPPPIKDEQNEDHTASDAEEFEKPLSLEEFRRKVELSMAKQHKDKKFKTRVKIK